jgi:hypothetical protein
LSPAHDETGELVAWQHPTADGGKLKRYFGAHPRRVDRSSGLLILGAGSQMYPYQAGIGGTPCYKMELAGCFL